jgi:VWFA-related protein
MRRPRRLPALPVLLGLLLLALALAAPAATTRKERKAEDKAREEAIGKLPEKYRDWLHGVRLIMSEEELDLFVALEKDYQRDAFIERFWAVRDPIKRTARNEFRDDYEARLEWAKRFNYDDRARILLLNGMPTERFELDCTPTFWPLEAWYYAGSDRSGSEFVLLFYQRGRGRFLLWDPSMGYDDLYNVVGSVGGDSIDDACKLEDAEILRAALAYLVASQGSAIGASLFLHRIQEPPEAPEKEWVTTFSTYSTDLPDGAATFAATTDLAFPGRHQSRTVLQATVAVPAAEVVLGELGPAKAFNLMLNGEVLQDDELFENFRYKYDFPAAEVAAEGAATDGDAANGDGATLPLVFQRYLRPGDYRLIVKVEDLNGGGFYRYDAPVTVPKVEAAPPPAPDDPETARILAEANAAIASGENTIKIVPPMGDWQTGLVRVDTLSTGEGVAAVAFMVDGRQVLTKRSPPFNVELDFGDTPRALTLRVEAHDAAGETVASDELLLNAGQHRFAVHLSEPQPSKTYRRSLRAYADVSVPDGELVERVEFYLNETLVASVYQPPYVQPIVLPDGEFVAYVRAVAYTPDGAATEDVVFINAPDYVENVDVDLVELYTAVLDKQGRPVEGLTRGDFRVLEDGVAQEVLRFEQVRDLSIHAAVMLDVSASMSEELAATQAAALSFFEQAVTPRDRAAIITFNDHPNLVTKFTNQLSTLASGLAGLRAERGTALYDSLVFALYYFNGIRGQRAILLLSDGKDESSRYEWDDALDYARRAGVALYAIGLNLKGQDADARKKLERLAEETGGRSFFIESTEDLAPIYETIQRELRSRYLLAYQSSNVKGSKVFRTVEVEMAPAGLEAKTIRGYYP